MKYLVHKLFLISVLVSLINLVCFSQNDSLSVKKVLTTTEISGKWYLIYKYNISKHSNNFALKRGYITLQSGLSHRVSVRYTQDITVDSEGSDAGNVEIRMKYIYMKLKPFKKSIFENSFAEFGLVHRPFVDFEQHINSYRSQGKMFIEKTGIVNTAGFGVLFAGLIGGKLSPETLKKTGKNQPGKFGSYALGIYNGGGYHNFENNNNKTVEGRLTIRPFNESLPGMQFTYAGIYGKGNTSESHDFIMNLGALTYENSHYVLTGQYYFGKGDYEAKYFDIGGLSAVNKGFSFFGEFLIPKTSFALFGRYDNFSSNQVNDYFKTGYFTGISYRFLNSKVFVCYEQNKIGNEKDEMFELVLDVVF